ncbi:hypothetical protein G7046_g2992 [Stylonectria norvegica]|nr:hypothetical protein G7046_g2992 [Stylonectria norvegica]
MATVTAAPPQNEGYDIEKRVPETSEFPEDLKHESDDSSEFKQDGVKHVEAVTQVWSKQMMVIVFVLLYLISFIDSLLQSVQGNLTPYVTSAFSEHGLLGTIGIVSSIMGGVCTLAIAKVIDIWGRVQGFAVMILLIVVGMIMKATCQNVETYAAAQTIYWVGHLGLLYVIQVVVADMTTLQNRMIIMGINGTPNIASTFAGPKIAELFYTNVNFRWAFGSFCIIFVAFSIPVIGIFIYNERKAKNFGIIPEKEKTRTFWESSKYYFFQFDVIGMFLTIAGWSLLLLPFSLVNTAPDGWKTGYLYAMIVVGFFCLVAFGVWEKWFSPVPYFPFRFLTDRTILGSCLLYGFMFISIFCWDTYYSSYLQVVHFQSITISGYVLNTFSLTSSFIAPFVGLAIRYFGQFKWPSFVGVPFVVLGTVLLILFRRPHTHIGYLVMCQLFNGIGTGIWAATGQLAVMACVNHQEVAVALALWGMFGSIGAAIGYAIAGGIWTNVLPDQLYKALPEAAKNETLTIYGDITVQLAYERDSPIRDAIIEAYSDVQRKMVIAGSAFIPLLLVFLFMWRNIDIKKKDAKSTQARGNVF